MEGGREVIVIRTVSVEEKKHYDKDGVYCRRVRFHELDLSGGKIKTDCFPSMLNRIADGVMLLDSDGPVVYLLGGLPDRDDDILCEPLGDKSNDDLYYKSGFRLDLQKQLFDWEQIHLPIKNRFIPCCASLFGKLYEFGYLLDTPEVYDPSLGIWKELSPLPDELVGSRLSGGGVIPDPSNSRLLVHLSVHHSQAGQLYAFYPEAEPGAQWKRLCCVPYWSNHNVVLVDGVLYIHDSEARKFLCAYDVDKATQLKLCWSTRLFEYSTGFRVDATKYPYDAMFYAGDGHFWMASWSPTDKTSTTAATIFIKFKAVRRPDNGDIVCTPVDIQCHHLPKTNRVSAFLHLHLQEASN